MNAFELLLQFTYIHMVCEDAKREPTSEEEEALAECERELVAQVKHALMIDDDDDILIPEVVYGPNYTVCGLEFVTYDPLTQDRRLMFKLTL